jgi:cell surface protein SprA
LEQLFLSILQNTYGHLNLKIINISAFAVLLAVTCALSPHVKAAGNGVPGPYWGIDTTGPGSKDSLKYPIHDRRGDRYSSFNRSSLDLKNPGNIRDSVVYDPKTRQFIVYERIGNTLNFRKPTYYTFEEYMRIIGKQQEAEYFKKRSNTLNLLNRKIGLPKFSLKDDLFNRIFGTGKIEIKPQGNVDITLGYQGQNIKNPALPERARRNGGFDFDPQANIGVNANIGDKLRLPINFNTRATFDFENQFKLDYAGRDDEILKRFEAGNVAYQSKGTLIPSTQGLFGLKTQLQFGRFFITTVLANQRTQRQSLGLQGGAAATPFSFKADEYEENRHFLLAHYFRGNYNTAMKNLPIVASLVQIQRMEVWVTNRNGSTTETRDVVGLMDLGEINPFQPPPVITPGSQPLPHNDANNLYAKVITTPGSRDASLVQSRLQGLGLTPVQDYEKTFARKLRPDEYFFNPQIGFISLQQPLQPDEVLGVAFQYTYNGRPYQVGEFSQDLPPDSSRSGPGTQKVLFLKLLKATSQRPALPIWDLMMKNVYSVGFGQLNRDGFKLNVLYEEPGRGEKRFLPEGDKAGVPLINLLNLDRLNNQNDPVIDANGNPVGDGQFDFIEGYTALSNQSRIFFPVLEPFGKDLEFAFTDPLLRSKYVYYALYDTIKAIAQTYANFNRYIIRGNSKSSSSSEIYLGAFNIPPGSVTVSAGGQTLIENSDYTIDYNLGQVRILNQAILNSGIPVNVQFENNAGFGLQNRSFLGLRADYIVRNTAKQSITFGASMVRLSERPFFTKTNYSEDPIRNTMYGADFSYRSEFPRLTRWLDKLPFYTTNTMSTVTAYGEAALLKPGHPKQIGAGAAGLSYMDDFEGTRNAIDLRFPLISWTLASAPQKAKDRNGVIMFPEAELTDDLAYGFNRAKIAWYNIEPVLQERRNPNNPLGNNLAELSDPRVRAVSNTELFPQRTPNLGENQLVTFDMAYYPEERGPYNFDARPLTVNPNGTLKNPRRHWGGIMRAIDQVDFETSNTEFIEFWVQDPFIINPASAGGDLYFHLGNISEDVMKDGRRFFENGLSTPASPTAVDNSSKWGRTPANPLQVNLGFNNDPSDRPFQDVGFDGLSTVEEQTKFAQYLTDLSTNFGASSPVFTQAKIDPASDNYVFYRDDFYNQNNIGILGRYKNINNPDGNSPVATAGSNTTNAYTLYPDQEELNRDNTLNELEEYFQYRVEMKPNMAVGTTRYLTDKRTVNVRLADGNSRPEVWYLFRIPIAEYTEKVGNIPDFKSIRFIRMFMTNFSESVVMRFGKLELVRNQWRQFSFKIDSTGIYQPTANVGFTSFNTLAVNVEENDRRSPINYVIPPGIERVQQLSNNNVNLLLNEQALSLRVCNLVDGDARGVFKTLPYDLRRFGKLSLFVHAEAVNASNDIKDKEMNAVVRIGSDFVNNYYEVKIPLTMTAWGETSKEKIWPEVNNMELVLEDLVKLKLRRDANTGNPGTYYKEVINGKTYGVIGSPNLGEIRGVLLGMENPKDLDGQAQCAELWFNELRLSGLNEQSGWAALGRVDIQMADLGMLSFSGNIKSHGFGTIEQRVNERAREDYRQFDASATLELGKLLPKKAGISLPMYASISQVVTTPEFDPFDQDVKYKEKLRSVSGKVRDSIRNAAIDLTTIKTLNFTNVRVNPTTSKKPKLWSLQNFDFTYSYTSTKKHNPLIESDELTRHHGGLGYNFQPQPKFWEPFKKLIRSKSPWFNLIKDIGFNPAPSLLSFRADVNRQFGATRPRNVGGGPYKVPETYDKYFTFDRVYNLRWDITRSFNVDFSATNNARIDEPYGRIDTRAKKEEVRTNLLRGGRNTIYNQRADFTYTLPLAKLPLLDWTSLTVNYNTTYKWIGASRLAINLGNTLENSQSRVFTGKLNFEQLYAKSKLLRAIQQGPVAIDDQLNQGNAQSKPDTIFRKNGKIKRIKFKKDRNSLPTVNGFARAIGRILTMAKMVDITYTEDYNTRLPGYTDSTQYLGQNWKSAAPGFNFIFGYQPDTSWINNAARKGLLTKDPVFNFLIQQSYSQKLNITARLEPIRDLVIDINLTKAFSKNYSELYKDTTGTSGFKRLNPYAAGGFDISFIAVKSLFEKVKPNEISATFQKFQDNRIIISQRLGKLYPAYAQLGQGNGLGADGFYYGYGRYAQDVLIPAFIAAYSGKDANTIPLLKQSNANIRANPFAGILPRPNWNLRYNGLTRIKGMEKIFTNFTIDHGYTSSLSMNSFASALLYQDTLAIKYPTFFDTVSKNFIPFFLVPNITLKEDFGPLIRLNMDFVNQVTASFEFKKGRTLSLSLIDYQLSEVRTQEFVVGIGWRKRGFPLPFKIRIGKFEGKKLENDINFKLDFSIRDDITSNSRLDQLSALPTSGQKVITISPYINYVLNNRVNIKLFFDQRRVIPYTSISAPITTTRAGLQLQISLSQ